MLRRLFAPHVRNHSRPRPFRPRFETLEDRVTPADAGWTILADPDFGGPVYDIATADVNNDGDLDLVSVNNGSSSVSVLLGNGDGTFQAAQSFATGAEPRQLAVADFDNDGNFDVATANVSNFSVLLGNGNGTFQAPLNSSTTNYSWLSITAGELNNDGNADLILGLEYEYGFCALRTLTGNGDGTFSLAYEYWGDDGQIPAFPALATNDINEDGWNDIVLAHGPGMGVSIWQGNGDGTLVPLAWEPAGFYHSGDVTIVDFNADGHLDLAGVYGTEIVQGYAGVVLGNGDGTFGAVQSYPTADYGSHHVGAADVDGDGVLDLVTLNVNDGSIGVLMGNGTGGFGTVQNFAIGSTPGAFILGDFEGDGFPDAAIVVAGSGEVVVLHNNGDWNPLPPPPSVTISDAIITEPNQGSLGVLFTVTLSSATPYPIEVSYATSNGTATTADYVSASDTLWFSPGQTSLSFVVMVRSDLLNEPNETFFVNLSNPVNATISDSQGVGTIVDNKPHFTITDVTKAEGKSGNTAFIFTVTLSKPSTQTITVSYQTENGTAQAGSDYTATSGTLTFSPGQTSKTITVNVKGDKTVEGNETFFVRLFNASTNALILDELGLGLILNDD